MPNRDNAPVLDMVLEKLVRHTDYDNFELIVVDDESTDGSREILRRWRDSKRFASFELIERVHGRGGVVAALNQGLEAASGELVVQLDADASVETDGWLEKLAALFSIDDAVGLVTARIVSNTGILEACGIDLICPEGYHNRGIEVIEAVGRRTSFGEMRHFGELEWPGVNQLAEVDGGVGVCMMYRRAAAVEVGGYDLGYAPVAMDDIDLTISLRRIGLKCFYHPGVRVVHHKNRLARPDDQPADPGSARRAATGIRHNLGTLLPNETRTRLVRALGLNRPPRMYRQRARRHRTHWRRKWGFDVLNPDLAAVRARWGETELCWKTDPGMKQRGESILARYDRGDGVELPQEARGGG